MLDHIKLNYELIDNNRAVPTKIDVRQYGLPKLVIVRTRQNGQI